MNYWLISDPHLGHRALEQEAYGGRPKDFEHLILKNLKVVKPNDVFISLGDNTFYNHEYWNNLLVAHLPVSTKKYLVIGNHDKKSVSWYLNHGWHIAANNISLSLYGYNIILSHTPIAINDNYVNIHGHLHSKQHREFNSTSGHYLVSMELQNYSPITLRNLLGA